MASFFVALSGALSLHHRTWRVPFASPPLSLAVQQQSERKKKANQWRQRLFSCQKDGGQQDKSIPVCVCVSGKCPSLPASRTKWRDHHFLFFLRSTAQEKRRVPFRPNRRRAIFRGDTTRGLMLLRRGRPLGHVFLQWEKRQRSATAHTKNRPLRKARDAALEK